MKRRDANMVLVTLGAMGGGAVMWSLPLSLLERAVQAMGLPAIAPSMAPPLGSTAQMLFVGAGAILCALLVAMVLPWGTRRRADGGYGGTMMSFLLSGLAAFAHVGRRSRTPASLEHHPELDDPDATPVLRRSDAHPDAPARAPLFIRELGEDTLPLVAGDFDDPAEEDDGIFGEAGREAREPVVRDITGLSMPRAPEPLPWDLIEREMSRVLSGVGTYSREEEGDEIPDMPPSEPSIAALADRLEKGLMRRRARLAGAPETPAGAAEEARGSATMPGDDDAADGQTDRRDEELDRALTALRSITQGAG